MIKKFGIQCAHLYGDSKSEPFELNYGEIGAFGKTDAPYQHIEAEWFYVISGQGKICLDGVDQEIKAGALISVDEYQSHQISNLSEQPMQLLSLTTKHPVTANQNHDVYAAALTPNGEMHLGHLSGPYLAADVIARHQRQQGNQAKLYTGTDINPSFCKNTFLSEPFKDALNKSQIEADHFFEPQLQTALKAKATQLLNQLLDSEFVSEQQAQLPYCNHCQHNLHDGEILGRCPHCQQPSQGHCCENCFHHADAKEGLIEPRCSACHNLAELKSQTVYCLQLDKLKQQLQSYWQKMPMSARLAQLVSQFSENLNQFPLAYYSEQSDGVIYPSWIDALSYLSELNNPIHCFGYDNAYYFCVLIPSLLILLDLQSHLAKQWVVNDFLLLEQAKFSTSKNHAIWVKQVEDSEIDYLRWYLAINRPEQGPANFNPVEFTAFKQQVKMDLNHLNQESLITEQAFVSANTQDRLYRRVDLLCQQIQSHYHISQLSISKAATHLLELLQLYLHYKDSQQPTQLLDYTRGEFIELLTPISPKLAKALLQREPSQEELTC